MSSSIAAVLAVVFLVFYVMRRRARLSASDE
jgi:hypothetical protein